MSFLLPFLYFDLLSKRAAQTHRKKEKNNWETDRLQKFQTQKASYPIQLRPHIFFRHIWELMSQTKRNELHFALTFFRCQYCLIKR